MKRILGQVGLYLLVALIILYAVFPFYYAIVSSLKPPAQLFRLEYFPTAASWDNYVSVFREQPFARNILNSLLVSVSVVALSLLLGVTAAYALGRVQFRGRGTLPAVILGVSMFSAGRGVVGDVRARALARSVQQPAEPDAVLHDLHDSVHGCGC